MKKDIMNIINEKVIEELQEENLFLKDLITSLFKEISDLEQQLEKEVILNELNTRMQEEELEEKNELIFELKKELNKVDLLMMLQNKK